MDRQQQQHVSGGNKQGPIPSPIRADDKYEVDTIISYKEDQAKQQQFKAILNTLMPQNFDKLLEQVEEVTVDAARCFARKDTACSSSSFQAPLFCKICMEMVPSDELFQASNDCAHVFCRDCLSLYLGTKIQENISAVKCPEENCEALLEPVKCRELLSSEVFERWGSALCESMLLGAHKFYCPFKDCSELLVDDGEESVTSAECPSCRRLFCAACKVAWHASLSCEEFGNLGKDERGKEDLLMMQVAKEKNWKRCPSCKYFVEKNEGCNHITCRCGFQFCYGCGKDWSSSHACS